MVTERTVENINRLLGISISYEIQGQVHGMCLCSLLLPYLQWFPQGLIPRNFILFELETFYSSHSVPEFEPLTSTTAASFLPYPRAPHTRNLALNSEDIEVGYRSLETLHG
jgi:hypothetical protein